MSINNVALTGNLTRDAELKMTKSELAVLEFSIAVNDRKQVDGEWQDYPHYFACSLFGKRAESLAKILTKGTKVSITGKLQQDRWQQDGQYRSRVHIVVSDLDFMSKAATSEKADTVDYA